MSIKKPTEKEYGATLIYHKLEKLGWIERFRAGWSIPQNGLSSMKSYHEWRKEHLTKATNRFLKSKKYLSMLKEQEKQRLLWARGKVLFSEIEHVTARIEDQQPLIKFTRDISSTMTKLGIPERYEYYVEHALVLNKPPSDPQFERERPKLVFFDDPNTGRKRLFVEVFADTKASDFSDRYIGKIFRFELQKAQKGLYDHGTMRQLGAPNLVMYGQIYDWHIKDKKTYAQIRILAKEQFGHTFSSKEDVGKYLNRYKKLLGTGTIKTRK